MPLAIERLYYSFRSETRPQEIGYLSEGFEYRPKPLNTMLVLDTRSKSVTLSVRFWRTLNGKFSMVWPLIKVFYCRIRRIERAISLLVDPANIKVLCPLLTATNKYRGDDRHCQASQASQESFFHVAQRSCHSCSSALRSALCYLRRWTTSTTLIKDNRHHVHCKLDGSPGERSLVQPKQCQSRF